MSLTSRVSSGKVVKFMHYQSGNLWYRCEDGFEFPVPLEDTGTASFNAEDKAIMFMKWIRKHMTFIEEAKI